MLHTDSAYALLSETLEQQGIEIESQEITEKEVLAVASSNGVDIKVWFDADSQQFGFDLLTGGTKKYDNLDDFVKYFQTYFSISTDVVPKAKMLADTIEDSLNVKTIYDTFKGNKTSGYYVIFRVLGDDTREILITQNKTNKDLYKVEVVLYNKGRTQQKIEHEFLYEVDDEANIKELVTLDSYITNLEKYKDSLDIKRVGTKEFLIVFTEEETIHFSIHIKEGKVLYKVLTYNDRELNLELTLKDDYDLYALRDLVRSKLPKKSKSESKPISTVDDMLEESGMSTKNLSDVEDLAVSEQELSEIGEIKEMPTSQESTSTTAQDTTVIKTGMSLADDMLSNPITSEPTEQEPELESESVIDSEQTSELVESEISDTNNIDNCIEITLVKLIKTDGRITGVLFVTTNGLYKMSKEVALEFIPLSVIETFTSTVHNKGICITEEEKEQKKFAKDVSFDKEFCSKLVEALF